MPLKPPSLVDPEYNKAVALEKVRSGFRRLLCEIRVQGESLPEHQIHRILQDRCSFLLRRMIICIDHNMLGTSFRTAAW